MGKIFISYKRKNLSIIKPIIDEIERETGAECWYDLEGIETSAQFTRVICEAINSADVVLFMHSSCHSEIVFEEDWTIKELDYAFRKNKRVVLVKLDNSPLGDEFSFVFGLKNYININDEAQKQKLYSDLNKWFHNGKAQKVQTSYFETQTNDKKRGQFSFQKRRISTILILVFISSLPLAYVYLKSDLIHINKDNDEQISWYYRYISELEDSLNNGDEARYKALLYVKKNIDTIVRFERSHSLSPISDSLSRVLTDKLQKSSMCWISAAQSQKRKGRINKALEFYCLAQDLYDIDDATVNNDYIEIANSLGNMLV